MLAILKREFFDSFKSIRTILIIFFITIITYQTSAFLGDYPELLALFMDDGFKMAEVYSIIIAFLFYICSFLFVFAISHDIINKEIELKTMRLLVTKVSRFDVLLGKTLATFLFWLMIATVSFAIVAIFSHAWQMKEYLQTIIVLFYIVNFVILCSTLIANSKLTMFLGVILGLTIPIIGMISMLSTQWYFKIFSYIFPYGYLDQVLWQMLIPFAIGLLYFGIAYYVLERRDF